MAKVDRIQNILVEENEEVTLIKGFEKALMGIYRYGGEVSVPVYSYLTLIELLVKDDGMAEEDAVLYVDNNILSPLQILEGDNLQHTYIIVDDTGV